MYRSVCAAPGSAPLLNASPTRVGADGHRGDGYSQRRNGTPPAALNDYYALLHLQPGCSAAAIRSAYRRLARRYHPDLNPSPDATRRMAALNEAYAVLGNPRRRRAYDLARGHTAPLRHPAQDDRPVGRPGGAQRHSPIVTPARCRSPGATRPHGGRRDRRSPWMLALVPVLLAGWMALLILRGGDGTARPV
ncbi:MAG: hypothetical protein C4290_13910, partial [Chloroflexota bacterium]